MATLLVTNDFPPTIGGIQSYLRDYAAQYVARGGKLIVYTSTPDADAAPEWDATQPYDIIRTPRTVLLPTPGVARELERIIRTRHIDTVWFGAAAPLGILATAARRAGARRIVATTHGHEVGWSMLPGARRVLRRIGDNADVVTYISRYTLGRFASAFGPHPQFVALPSGVDTEFFRAAGEKERVETRRRLGVGSAPLVVCASRLVPRKGQDRLICYLPHLRRLVEDTRLVIVGSGPYEKRLRRLAAGLPDPEAVIFTGEVSREELRDIVAAADVFAMPARTRGRGLDVEGLGIVYLEAQACAVPVLAGDSGGAPETVSPATGVVVNGRDRRHIVNGLAHMLRDAHRRESMGTSGRQFVEQHFAWSELGQRLSNVLDGNSELHAES